MLFRSTHFEIYDAVGIYDALEPLSTMKPVVANANTTFDDLIRGLEVILSDSSNDESDMQRDSDNNIALSEQKLQNQIDMIIAKMRRMRIKMSENNRAQFASLCGGRTPEKFIDDIRHLPTNQAVDLIKKSRNAFDYMKGEHIERPVFISDKEDKLVSHERGYGDATKPEDYLREFQEFIDNNINEIAALNIVATRPKELTRKDLKELKLVLDRNNFNETMLNTAWKEMTNEDIAADIISFIRQRSLGDALISKNDRIHNAIAKTKRDHPELNKMQLNWLDRIEAYLMKETVLGKESFDAEAFRNKGGYNAVNKAFGEKLDDFIDEINDNMYSA